MNAMIRDGPLDVKVVARAALERRETACILYNNTSGGSETQMQMARGHTA